MPTEPALLGAGPASRRIAGHDGRRTGPRVGRGDAVWRGLGAGGRGRREPARWHHEPVQWRYIHRYHSRPPVAITPGWCVNQAVGAPLVGTTGATHPPTPAEDWIYTFALLFYVNHVAFGFPNRWRIGVVAHV